MVLKMKIYVDIDETICFYEGDRNYPDAKPIKERIERVNRLYEEGHEITYWTARGNSTGLDWTELTKNQLLNWGCKYHHVSVGIKPSYDLLIWDKAITSEMFFSQLTSRLKDV